MKSGLDFLPYGALALLFLVVIANGQLRIGLIALLLVLVGIATLHLLDLLRPAQSQHRSLRHPTYMAVGLGSVVILVWTGLLKALGLYSFGGMIVVLCGYVLLALAWRRPPSEMLSVREAAADPWCLRYLCSVLLVFLLLPASESPDLAGSAVYLTQGFDLFFEKDPAGWPYFGEVVRMPLMYVTHNIGATFALFSSGDPNDYFLHGQYVLNILIAPLIPIGAYMFFARRLPWWAAGIAAYGFCWSILARKLASLRGETLGWVLGFAFLLALEDLYANAGQLPSKTRAPARTGVVLAILYFGLALTHGVVAMIVTFLAIGITAARLIAEQNRLSLISDACKAGAAAAVVLCLLVPGYVYSFSPNFSLQELIHSDGAAPIPGEKDPALLLENAVSYPEPIDITPVHASPPFIDPLDVAQIGAFLPPAALFRADLTRVPITEFPHKALQALSQIPLWERAAYALLGLFSCLLYVSPARSRRLRFGTVVYAAAAAYLLPIAFGIYLDYASVSIFPLAAWRRTYVYGAAFFWIAVGATFLDLALAGLKHRVPNYLAQASRRYLAPACLIIGLPWLLVGILANQTGGAESKSQWVREHLISRLSGGDSQTASDAASYRALAEATNFIRENTRGGDWVGSNIVSDNQFWFLTHGRYSWLEGSVMYQVHSIQKGAADRLMGVYKLLEDGDATPLGQFDIKYIALYKYCRCRTPACFGYNVIPARMSMFKDSHLFTTAFENDEFLILRRDQSVPLHAILNRSVKANGPADCYDPNPPPRGATWAQGIDFSKPSYPQFVQEVKGVGNLEPWGRWTVDDEAVFHFSGPLPRRFVLKLKMDAFGPNVDQPVTVTVGRTTKSFKISRSGERFNLEFDLPQGEDTIRFQVPRPTRPHDLDPRQWEDTRRLGLGFMELKVDDWYYADAEPYSGTYAEGADFSRPGLPWFLVEASGLGPQDSWGRKIVGDKAVFRFWEPLQKQFHLLFTMKALGSAEVPITVTAGPIEKAIKVKAESEQFDLTFDLPETSDTISFKVGDGSRGASEPDGDVAIADLKLNF